MLEITQPLELRLSSKIGKIYSSRHVVPVMELVFARFTVIKQLILLAAASLTIFSLTILKRKMESSLTQKNNSLSLCFNFLKNIIQKRSRESKRTTLHSSRPQSDHCRQSISARSQLIHFYTQSNLIWTSLVLSQSPGLPTYTSLPKPCSYVKHEISKC